MVDTDDYFVFVVYVTWWLVAQSVYAKIVVRVNNESERLRKVLYWHLRGRSEENDEKKNSVQRASFPVWSLKFRIRTANRPAKTFD
jgi:hypothetical protein